MGSPGTSDQKSPVDHSRLPGTPGTLVPLVGLVHQLETLQRKGVRAWLDLVLPVPLFRGCMVVDCTLPGLLLAPVAHVRVQNLGALRGLCYLFSVIYTLDLN